MVDIYSLEELIRIRKEEPERYIKLLPEINKAAKEGRIWSENRAVNDYYERVRKCV